MIHSKEKDPSEVFEFAKKFRKILKTLHLYVFQQVIIMLKRKSLSKKVSTLLFMQITYLEPHIHQWNMLQNQF